MSINPKMPDAEKGSAVCPFTPMAMNAGKRKTQDATLSINPAKQSTYPARLIAKRL